jgi:hypothetical protein
VSLGAGEGTRTLDIQLGSKGILFEIGGAANRVWSAIFAVLSRACALTAPRLNAAEACEPSGLEALRHPVDELRLTEAVRRQVDEDVGHAVRGIRDTKFEEPAVPLDELDHTDESRPLVAVREWVVLDDSRAEDRGLLSERRVGLDVAETRSWDVQSRVGLGNDSLRAPKHLGRNARDGFCDQQEVAQLEIANPPACLADSAVG